MSDTARYDAIVVGAGPAGAVCTAHLAKNGRKVLLIEKARFPRDKVCGDCLHPDVWPILSRLELHGRALQLPHSRLSTLHFHGVNGETLSIPLSGQTEEIAIRRWEFDALLAKRAVECGADLLEETAVTQIEPRWKVTAGDRVFHAPVLIAADGRNSTVARFAGRLPRSNRERAGLQCHCPLPASHGPSVQMFFHTHGYGGTAAVSDTEMNVCVVGPPSHHTELKRFAEERFGINGSAKWQSIAPISRPSSRDIARDGLYLIGDAARVVEPFTGEGIYYAMRSGELAAQVLLDEQNPEAAYRSRHLELYRGRLWINRVARIAGHHPKLASALIGHLPAVVATLARRALRS